MSDLVFIRRGTPYTSSLVVSERTGISHRHVKARIEAHRKALESFGLLVSYAAESTGGRPQEIIRLNEQQATLLMTFLKNTRKVIEFKVELVRQFYEMRSLLMEQKTSFWKETQQAGREVRKSETDVIKAFSAYAEQQGSHNAGRYYISFSALANRTAGVKERKLADTAQLSAILLAEKIIRQAIQDGMARGVNYKEIYRNAKQKTEQLRLLAAVPQISNRKAV